MASSSVASVTVVCTAHYAPINPEDNTLGPQSQPCNNGITEALTKHFAVVDSDTSYEDMQVHKRTHKKYNYQPAQFLRDQMPPGLAMGPPSTNHVLRHSQPKGKSKKHVELDLDKQATPISIIKRPRSSSPVVDSDLDITQNIGKSRGKIR